MKRFAVMVLALAAVVVNSAMGQVPPQANLEHGTGTMRFWKDAKFTPDTTDPAGRRGTWSGWFRQDNVDASKLGAGIVRARLGGEWQDLKVVTLPEGFLKWNFEGRLSMLATIARGGMPPIHGPHDGIVASHGMKRIDSDFDINNAVKGIGWLPRPEKLAELTALLKSTWEDSMEQKVARLESLYRNGREVFDLTKQSSLELYAQPDFETHTFLNQMVDAGVALVFLDLPKSYELRCVAQMLHPEDPGLSVYEKQVVEYINLVHDYFHGRAPRRAIGVIYHVVQVFDNSPGTGRGRRIVPSLP